MAANIMPNDFNATPLHRLPPQPSSKTSVLIPLEQRKWGGDNSGSQGWDIRPLPMPCDGLATAAALIPPTATPPLIDASAKIPPDASAPAVATEPETLGQLLARYKSSVIKAVKADDSLAELLVELTCHLTTKIT